MENRPTNIDLRNKYNLNSFYQKRNRVEESSRQRVELPIEDKFPKKDEKIIARIFDKIIGLSICMLFFGIPLYFTNLTLQGIIFEKQMFFYFWLLLGLASWIAKGIVNGEMNIRRTPLDFPIIGFWLAYIISAFFSVDYWHSFWGSFIDPSRGFISVTAFIIAYYLIFSNFNSNRLKIILSAIISSGIALIIWTLLVIFGIKFLPNNLMSYVPFSLVGSITTLGIIFSYLLPVFMMTILKIADMETLNQKVKKIQKIITLGLLFLFLILDLFLILVFYNYILWAGLFIGMVVFLIYILTKIVRPNIYWIWLPMVIFIAVVIFKATGDISINNTNLPIEVSLNYPTSKEIVIESIKNKAIVGSGPATYGYDFSMYRPKDFNLNNFYSLRFFQGSGIIAEAIPTIGILGTFFLLIIILSYIGSQAYLLIKDREKNKLYSLGLFSSSIILLTNALFFKADGVSLLLTVIFSALSLSVLLSESRNERNFWNLSLKSSPKFALVMAFIFITISTGIAFVFVYLGQIYLADIYAGKASGIASQDLEKAISYLNKSIKYDNRESKYYVQIGQYYMGLANKEALKEKDSRDINIIQSDLNNSIAVTVKAKDMSKNNVEIIESLALIYENAGLYIPESLNLAEENYKRAEELEPYNAVYDLKLGQISISMAQSETNADKKKQKVIEAKDLFQKSIDKKNNYSEGYYQLALTNEALNELDQAIDNAKKAAQFDSKNTDYLLFLGRLYQLRNKNDDMKLAEGYYKKIITVNDKNLNAHFYLGLLYEKIGNKTEAKNEYNKVINLLNNNKENSTNQDTITKIQKMIENVNKGIENTPENLGLTQSSAQQPQANDQQTTQPVQPNQAESSPSPENTPEQTANPLLPVNNQ